ncbi:hypothetical protein AAIR98_001689 [Elusimicrobium simillimum]|uniref:hypothetical protein n=1 Tax=Elusimicrobium simillimum TaxID=3143438 RepID=UPI003C6FB903
MKKTLITLMVAKKIITLILVLFFAAGCRGFFVQTPDWIPTGPVFAPNKGEVELYSNYTEIKRPYGNLGMIRMKGVPQRREDVKSALNTMVKFAAEKGADAVIVAQEAEGEGMTGTIMIVGYALKYVDNLTPEDDAAIKEFNLIGVIDEYTRR